MDSSLGLGVPVTNIKSTNNVGSNISSALIWTVGNSAGQISGQSGYGGIYDINAYVIDKYGSGWVLNNYGSLEPSVPDFLMTTLESGVWNCTLVGITRLFAYQRDNNGYGVIPDNDTLLSLAAQADRA